MLYSGCIRIKFPWFSSPAYLSTRLTAFCEKSLALRLGHHLGRKDNKSPQVAFGGDKFAFAPTLSAKERFLNKRDKVPTYKSTAILLQMDYLSLC